MKQLCSSPSGSCIMISQCACAPAWGGGQHDRTEGAGAHHSCALIAERRFTRPVHFGCRSHRIHHFQQPSLASHGRGMTVWQGQGGSAAPGGVGARAGPRNGNPEDAGGSSTVFASAPMGCAAGRKSRHGWIRRSVTDFANTGASRRSFALSSYHVF